MRSLPVPSPSLYAQYISEREGKDIVETENGYATYSFTSDACYIEDIYVKPEHRKSGEATKLADEIANIAKAKGYLKLYGSVVPSMQGATASLKVLLAYGFKLNSCINNYILFVKDLA